MAVRIKNRVCRVDLPHMHYWISSRCMVTSPDIVKHGAIVGVGLPADVRGSTLERADVCRHCGLPLWTRPRLVPTIGCRSTLRWTRGQAETGSISCTVLERGLQLDYCASDHSGAPLVVSEVVPFIYSDAGFSGRRRWLQCLRCGRGYRVIYGGRYFRCCLCCGLRYKSQTEPDYDRASSRRTGSARGWATRRSMRSKLTNFPPSRHTCAGARFVKFCSSQQLSNECIRSTAGLVTNWISPWMYDLLRPKVKRMLGHEIIARDAHQLKAAAA